jgi:hypothetical protein
VTAVFAGLTSGTASINCANPGVGGLLTGCTVSPSNTPNCSIPGGWTLAIAQGFEGGLTSSEAIVPTNGITTNNAHSGTHSLFTPVNADQAEVAWFFTGIGTINTAAYMSYWEYLDPNAAVNDEMELASLAAYGPGGNLLDELNFDRFGYAYNTLTPNLVIQPQGNAGGTADEGDVGSGNNIAAGAWHQWEFYWKPNTTSISNDGVMTIFKDGQTVETISPRNLNGPISMSGGTMFAGGVYSKFLWTSNGLDSGACQPAIGDGSPDTTHSGASFATLGAICAPTAPTFNRYIDDIIVIKK